MENKAKGKSPEQIIEDLENISPLNLSEYLIQCEFYDMQDAHDVLAEAVAEFEDKGGVASNLVEPVISATVNSVLMVGLRHFSPELYSKAIKGKLNLSGIVNKAINFQYPDEFLQVRSSAGTGHSNEIVHNQLRAEYSGVDKKYNQDNYRDKTQKSNKNPEGNRNSEFKGKQFQEKKDTVDVTGRSVVSDKNASRDKVGEADHVVPLKRIHEDNAGFVRRYSDEKGMKEMVNADENFQLLAGHINASKGGGKTNVEFIAYVEEIDRAAEVYAKPVADRTEDDKKAIDGLNSTQKKVATLKAKKGDLTDEEKASLDKYDLSDNAKKLLRENQKKAEKHIQKELLKSGAKTVGIEQIGRVLEVVVGPVSFEIRDMIANGMEHGVDASNPLGALWARVCRMMKYLAQELPRLLGDFFADLGQMLAHLAMSVFGIVKKIFGKFFDLVVQGLSTIKEAIKIISSSQYETSAEKADAIAKLLVTLATGVIGQFLIDLGLNALGIPDPWSEIIAALVASVLSTIVVYFFNKLDLFGVESDARYARVTEIFDARIKTIKQNTAQFDIAVSEKIKAQRIQFERYKMKMGNLLKQKDFMSVTETLTEVGSFFDVDIPYASSEDFVQYVRSNSEIQIRVT